MFDQEIAAVEAAATRAVDLVQSFADQDPSEPDSCWQNPTRMYEHLDQARGEALKAWKALEEAKQKQQHSVPFTSTEVDQDLRTHFMDMVTDAFADVLNEMKENENIDLDILVDCLQSGIEILSQEDKECLLLEDTEEDSTTPHEARRLELGFHVETTA